MSDAAERIYQLLTDLRTSDKKKKKSWQGQLTLKTGGFGGSIGSYGEGSSISGGPIANSGQALFHDDPGFYTVEFAVPRPPVDPNPAIIGTTNVFNALLTLNWKVEGTQIKRNYTLGGNGLTVSGLGQGMDVSIQDYTALGASGPLNYEIVFTMAKGVRPFTFIPPTLIGTTFVAGVPVFSTHVAIPAASSINVIVPQNAGVQSVEVVLASLLTPPVAILATVFQRNGAAVQKAYNPQVNIGFIALAPDVTNIFVNNKDAANAIDATVTFGVDG